MNPSDVIALLDSVPAFEPAAVQLLAELYALERAGELNSATLAGRQAEITAALKEMERYLSDVKQVTDRCTHLPAIPSSTVPCGF